MYVIDQYIFQNQVQIKMNKHNYRPRTIISTPHIIAQTHPTTSQHKHSCKMPIIMSVTLLSKAPPIMTPIPGRNMFIIPITRANPPQFGVPNDSVLDSTSPMLVSV
eukprot:TRINITY_DN5517_c0_g1_i1.p1 TRINITY_DN5517_c0_g1~~TRINITY_DN5517_c0_g1_i1.p1  ORF type:complete len:106 (-),score=0.12 TRINITY_DN5517_c0_g1_i1:60-377(-)